MISERWSPGSNAVYCYEEMWKPSVDRLPAIVKSRELATLAAATSSGRPLSSSGRPLRLAHHLDDLCQKRIVSDTFGILHETARSVNRVADYFSIRNVRAPCHTSGNRLGWMEHFWINGDGVAGLLLFFLQHLHERASCFIRKYLAGSA